MEKKIFTIQNFMFMILWLLFLVFFALVPLQKSAGWRIVSLFAAVLILVVIFVMADAFKTGVLAEKNLNLSDAERTLTGLFQNASHQILIFSGSLNPLLYGHTVIKQLQEAAIRGVDIIHSKKPLICTRRLQTQNSSCEHVLDETDKHIPEGLLISEETLFVGAPLPIPYMLLQEPAFLGPPLPLMILGFYRYKYLLTSGANRRAFAAQFWAFVLVRSQRP